MKNALVSVLAVALVVLSACSKKEEPAAAPVAAAKPVDAKPTPPAEEFSGMEPAYLVELAAVHQKHDNLEAALRALRRAAELEKTEANLAAIQASIGELLQKSGKQEEAMKTFQRAVAGLTDKATQAKLSIKLAEQHRQAKRFAEAEQTIQVAIKDAPADHLRDAAYVELLQIWIAKNTAPAELAKLNEKLAKSPNDRTLLKILARGYGQTGQPDKAINLFKKLNAADPNDVSYLAQLGNYSYQANAFSEGINYFQKLSEKSPGQRHFTYERIAWGYAKLMKSAEATEWAKKLGELATEQNPGPFVQQANIYSMLRMHPETVASYKKAIEIAPAPAKASLKSQLAYYLVGMRKKDEAMVVLDELIAGDGDENIKKSARQLKENLNNPDRQ